MGAAILKVFFYPHPVPNETGICYYNIPPLNPEGEVMDDVLSFEDK